ncbi:MAG: 5'-nucleotidase C-terminal domain-containing protein [Acidobacteria bacterium]|nr:5'-nucleotidase C-terminal domain-containing protein [Acidobacteriota bacterium]
MTERFIRFLTKKSPFSPALVINRWRVLSGARDHLLKIRLHLDGGLWVLTQISGIQFDFDGRKPVGSRVVKIAVNGQPLDEKRIYTLALTTYLAGGGDGYSMVKGAKMLIDPESAQNSTAEFTRLFIPTRIICYKWRATARAPRG